MVVYHDKIWSQQRAARQANLPQSSISLVYNSNVNAYQLGSFIFYSYYMYLEYCLLSIHTRQAYAVTKQNCEHSVNQLYCVYIPAGHSDLLNIVGTTYCLTDTIKYLIPHTHTHSCEATGCVQPFCRSYCLANRWFWWLKWLIPTHILSVFWRWKVCGQVTCLTTF